MRFAHPKDNVPIDPSRGLHGTDKWHKSFILTNSYFSTRKFDKLVESNRVLRKEISFLYTHNNIPLYFKKSREFKCRNEYSAKSQLLVKLRYAQAEKSRIGPIEDFP